MEKVQMAKDIRNCIKHNQLDLLKMIIEENPEMVNWMTPFGTWLHVAASHGRLDIIRYLIELEIDINRRGGTCSTNALERATSKGHLDIAEYLINAGIDIDTSEPERNPLFAAIYGGHFEIVQMLVENNVDIAIKYSGESMKNMDAIAFAIERGETGIATYLRGMK